MRIKNMSIFQNKPGMKFFIASRVFWFMFVLYLQPRTVKLLNNSDVFSDNHNTPAFNHLAVDGSTETVFIGAVNRLYKLSPDLKLLNSVTTTSNPNSTNYNEILVINELDQRVIACGCATEFVCEIYNFNDDLLKLSRISQNKISELSGNNACVSTMAFIAYGNPHVNDNGLPKLYFAASFSSYVSKQQAIAIRTFNPNNISEADKNGRAFDSDELIIKHRDLYQVNYVYGFKSGKYKYFLTTQRNSTERESPYVSKLIRICNDVGEPLSKGYAEIPIECKLPGNKGTYNLVQTATAEKPGLKLAWSLHITLDDDILFGVFSKVQEIKPTFNEPSDQSVLCIYSMKSIDEKINENIRNCFSGTGSRGFEFISQNQTCIENNQIIDSNFCISNANMPIVGNIPISAPSVIPLVDFPTAIATKASENGYDVFIGTKTGHLKMINLRDSTHACENADLEIDKESPVNSDLLFSPQKDSLYVMTKRKLTKIKLELLNCSSYTTYESCVKSNKEFCGWCVSTNACTKICDCPPQIIIVDISSKKVQIGASETIQLRIPSYNLISSNESIHCAFKIANQYLYTDGRLSMNDHYNVRCPVPEIGEFSRMQEDRDYSNVDFMIYASKIWSFAHTKIYFTYCNSYAFCTTCVSSMLECQWHLKEKKCIYYGKNITKDASIISNETSCKNMVAKHEQNILNISSNHTFSNTRNSSSECLNLANSCISCMGLDKKHNCGWCQNTNTCESRDNCSGPQMKYHYPCPGSPSPSISSFWPSSGPREGGTNVTIEGESLFYDFDNEDINQGITVAAVACTPYRDMYVPMKSITCVTEKSNASPDQEGPVVVYVNKKPVSSKQYFKFVDPKINKIVPNRGPVYGGTVLTIEGEDLDTGKNIQVFIGNASCLVFSLAVQEIKCITSSFIEKKENIIVKFDEKIANSSNNSFNYEYFKDSHHDGKGFNIEPKGITSGGVTILIHNATLLFGERLSFHVYNGNQTYTSSCNVQNYSTVKCLSPRIPDIESDSLDGENPQVMEYSLKDSATGKNISIPNNQSFNFRLYPDPEFHYFFNDSTRLSKNYSLTIIGQNIDAACQKVDINVLVGNETCEVVSLYFHHVICVLPKFRSSLSANGSKEKFDVLAGHEHIIVSIGQNFTKKVPRLPIQQNNPTLKIIIYSVAVLCVIGFLLPIAYHFIYRRRSRRKNSQKIKQMQQRINAMGMETIAFRQCIKKVLVEKQINLDEESLNILKLPNVTVEYSSTPIPKNSLRRLSQTHYLLPFDDKWEFPRSKLILGKCVGEGEFGRVVQGEAFGISPEYSTTIVAVKMLKDDSSDSDMIALVSEMEIMKSIGTHNNVLQLLGCCTQDGSLLIIKEFACHGNLRDYLRSHLPSANKKTPLSELSVKSLSAFALQIAEGMAYLASRKCIHRDLAARNILVGKDCTMKIGDFGLARDIQNKDYYKRKTNGRLPLKWMAPEALCHNIFSTQSDVWSYGILLWEIFTLGGAPYPSLVDLGRLYQALHSGYRMETPPNCSDEMYHLMRKCWSFLPDDRPLFSEIVHHLEEILSNDEIHGACSQTVEPCNLDWPTIHNMDDEATLISG